MSTNAQTINKQGVGASLHQLLYERADHTLKNIKFFRGCKDVVSVQEMESAIHAAILSVRTGRVQKHAEFPEACRKPIEAAEIVSSL